MPIGGPTSIRFKLTMGAIAVILVANSLLALVNIIYLQRAWQDELQTRVRLDLNTARAAYENRVARLLRSLQIAALDGSLIESLESGRQAELAAWSQRLHETLGADFLNVLDTEGKVRYRAQNPHRQGDSLAKNSVVSESLRQRKAAAASSIVTAEELAIEGEKLAERARFVVQPTPAARPTEQKNMSAGMLISAAVPVINHGGKVVGVLYGGNLLNRRYELVDSIKQIVFPAGTHAGKEVGTVTIFQGDLRIATNVVGRDGQRAVGTRMSEAVAREVLEQGNIWAAPAFVVDDWYITAYEPIRDPNNQVIGALYVGLLQAPFSETWTTVVIRFLVLMTLGTIVSLVLIYLVTMVVMRPIGRIVEMSRKMMAGDLSARVGIRPPGEIGLLCEAVDNMADTIAERESQLARVARQQVTKAEKLASIGRLAAGVAHEINNPLTGVLTFAHLMHDKPNMDDQDRQDLDLIIHETTRAADIVRGLLDFARERPVLMEPLDLNDVVRRTVRLIGNQKKFEKIIIEEILQPDLPDVRGDMNQLQQVVLNLSLNACAAMPQGGRLALRTISADGHVIMSVKDTGCGIKAEHLDKIFEPFFTTQEVGKGTGLGLSVTYGIVEQHGGELEVESQEGQGSTFTITFPALPRE